jgi:hypothetical protein
MVARFATRPLRTPFVGTLETGSEYQFPFRRLLDPTDFDFLRAAGLRTTKVAAFKTQRRRIARLWLRTLAADFNRVDNAAGFLLVESQADRPGLAATLFRKRTIFCCCFLRAEVQIALATSGYESRQSWASLEALEMLCMEMRKLADAPQRASAVVASA